MNAQNTDLLLTMNKWDYRLAGREKLGKRVDWIPGMGLDCHRLNTATADDGASLRKSLGISEKAFVLIFAAEFSRRKSHHILIQAMRLLPENVVLLLPGDGNLLEQCRAAVGRFNLSRRVIMPGYIEDIAPWYRAADAAVTSSRSEGLPFNVMEAMYMGLPVTASAVKGNEDLIRHEENGLLYPYGDAEELAACITRLLSDANLRQALARNARQAVQRYALENVLSEVMEKYLSALLPETDSMK